MHIIDFEASGLRYPCYPIQVGVIKESGETYEALIHPRDNWLRSYIWDLKAQEVHGISREKLIEEGRPAHEVAQELNMFLMGLRVYSDCPEYDLMWAEILLEECGIKRSFTVGDVTELFEWNPIQKTVRMLKDVAFKEYGLKAHDALSDAIAIQHAVRWKRNNYCPVGKLTRDL